MKYVDGFVLPVPKKNLHAYRRMARKAGKSGVSTAHSTTRNASATTCM
jgi:uncharacterized protein YbaA (DUF1428 family)